MADIVAPPTDQLPLDQPVPATPDAPATNIPDTASQQRTEAAPVAHTPGGWPAAPLALLSANTAVAGAAAAALTTGPLLALLAAGGTASLLTAGAQVRRRNDRHRNPNRRTAAQRSEGLLPRPRHSRAGNGGAGTAGGGRRSPLGRRNTNSRTGSAMQVPGGTRAAVRRTANGARSAAGQVKGLRDAHRAAHPSRAARREQRIGARHGVADARRNAQRQARQQRAAAGGRGPKALAARIATSPKAQQRQAKRDAARVAKRAEKGQAGSEKVTAKRRELRRAPARQAARWRLRRSAARFHARRAGHGLLALPILLLGTLSTALGRKLGFPALMYPGHRLWRWLNARAHKARYERDLAIGRDLADQEGQIDAFEALENSATSSAPENAVGRAVDRAPMSHNANTNLGVPLTTPAAGFNFADAAAEMESQAQSFEPDGMMQVLSAFEGLPEAMHSIARTFQILAERSDAEFPLEKEVGESLNDVFQLLQQTIGACEEVATTMRRVHEQDIRRHEDPRNGEDKWDTGNN